MTKRKELPVNEYCFGDLEWEDLEEKISKIYGFINDKNYKLSGLGTYFTFSNIFGTFHFKLSM